MGLHNLLSRWWRLDGTVGYFIASEHLREIIFYDYFGTPCAIPREAEKVLAGLYGSDWRVPVQSKRWTDFLATMPDC
jgi:hypothetical protein